MEKLDDKNNGKNNIKADTAATATQTMIASKMITYGIQRDFFYGSRF